MDSDRTGETEGLIIWVNVESLCCVFETKIRLYINDTLIKTKQTSTFCPIFPIIPEGLGECGSMLAIMIF